jgi:hypothetical protein
MGVPYSHISPEEGKNNSLDYVRQKYIKQWGSTEDVPYAHSIYKMIDDVIEYQLDNMADMDLEDFYRHHMQKHYEDRRNAIAFNDAWMAMKESRNG